MFLFDSDYYLAFDSDKYINWNLKSSMWKFPGGMVVFYTMLECTSLFKKITSFIHPITD